MNIAMIWALYDYHFATNRRLWNDCVMALSDEQFTHESAYSAGSTRNQIVHMMNWDEQWFARLREVDAPPRLDPADFPDRAAVRAYWDKVEATMQAYLAALDEAGLNRSAHYTTRTRGPLATPVWRILLHVVNHGTDHRAQVLALLHRLGAPTFEQDLMLYWWNRADQSEG